MNTLLTRIEPRSAGAVRAVLRSPLVWLGAVLVGAFALRLLWLDTPRSPYFDESDYVNAARAILGWPQRIQIWESVRAGIDPNSEHPPLGKILIAASMVVFGDGPLGWRLPSLVAGMVSLAAVYGIVRSLGGSAWTGVLAVALLALDVLTFVHARLAVLDGLLVAPMLVGAWLALRRRWVAAGTALAGATLVKVSGVFGLVAVVAWVAWSAAREGGRPGLRAAGRPLLELLGTYAVVAIGGLWLLDLRFTEYVNPLDHVGRILGFGLAYRPEAGPGASISPFASPPWVWLLGGGQSDYFSHVRAASLIGDPAATASLPQVIVHATLNPVLIATFLCVLVLAVARVREPDADLERWSITWIAVTFLPWMAIALLTSRWTFLYYLLPVMPGIAVVTAAVLRRLPSPVTWVYLASSLAAFAFYYPYRGVP